MLPRLSVAIREASAQIHTAAQRARAGVVRRRTTATHPTAASALRDVAPMNMAWAPEPNTR
jgi:hypothetical protein